MKYIIKTAIFFYIHFLFLSCSSSSINDTKNQQNEQSNELAKIVSVTTSGSENKYTFSVGILSPDTDCNQYADWWEVISEDGKLIYRRILVHSHIDEQPFVRSGGDVTIKKDQVVIVRVHMNNSGYSSITFKGSVANGYSEFKTVNNFADNLANLEPLPKGCAF
jgi:hypothetical protein